MNQNSTPIWHSYWIHPSPGKSFPLHICLNMPRTNSDDDALSWENISPQENLKLYGLIAVKSYTLLAG